MLTQNGKEVNHMTVDYCIINHGQSCNIVCACCGHPLNN